MRQFLEGVFWGLLFTVAVSFVEANRAFFAVLTGLLFIILYILPLFKKNLLVSTAASTPYTATLKGSVPKKNRGIVICLQSFKKSLL